MRTKFVAHILFVALLLIFLMGCVTEAALLTGIMNDRLKPCENSLNCVTSYASADKRQIDPIPYDGSAVLAFNRLKAVLATMKRVTVVSETDVYLRLEFRSLLFRFVDDVEFLIDIRNKLIHMRSASRVGIYDFGVNKRRLQKIRQSYLAMEF